MLHLEDVSNVEKDYIQALEDMEMKLLGEGIRKNGGFKVYYRRKKFCS